MPDDAEKANDAVAGAVAAEPAKARAGRYLRHTWMYTWASLLIAALVLLVVLIAQNTRHVRVGWVFGHSRVSLVFLVLFATVLGWILGVASSVLFRRRARRRLR